MMDTIVFFLALLLSSYTLLNFGARIAKFMQPKSTEGFSLIPVNIEVLISVILWTWLYWLLH